jgi:hypothetical protein
MEIESLTALGTSREIAAGIGRVGNGFGSENGQEFGHRKIGDGALKPKESEKKVVASRRPQLSKRDMETDRSLRPTPHHYLHLHSVNLVHFSLIYISVRAINI